MRKLKKILSVLSAVMVMSTCAVSAVYADEAVTEPTTENVSNEKITDVEEICKLLNDFGDECKINGFKAEISKNETIEGDKVEYVHVIYVGDTKYNSVTQLIEKFIEIENIDRSKISLVMATVLIKWFCDVNGDGKANVRDCAYIASSIAKGEELNYKADHNADGKVDVRDAATLARGLANKDLFYY